MNIKYQQNCISRGFLNLSNSSEKISETILIIAIIIIGLFIANLVWSTENLESLIFLLLIAGILLSGILLYLLSR